MPCHTARIHSRDREIIFTQVWGLLGARVQQVSGFTESNADDPLIVARGNPELGV